MLIANSYAQTRTSILDLAGRHITVQVFYFQLSERNCVFSIPIYTVILHFISYLLIISSTDIISRKINKSIKIYIKQQDILYILICFKLLPNICSKYIYKYTYRVYTNIDTFMPSSFIKLGALHISKFMYITDTVRQSYM